MGGGYFRLRTIRKILPIFLLIIALISVILIKTSQAKYGVGHIYEDIVTGNVVNNVGDLVIVGIYIDDEPVDEILDGNYEIDKSKTKCKINGQEVSGLEFSINGNKVGIFGITTKNTKCTIYLETKKDPLAPIIAQVKEEIPNFVKSSCLASTNNVSHSASDCGEETNGLYKETTLLGDTYYYRGSVNNNWVKYGTNESGLPIWWRIIRINEDNTVRLIYAGEGTDAPASADQVNGQGGYWINDNYGIDNTGYKFNNSSGYNAYVGYMYGTPGSRSFNAEHGYDLINNGTVDQLQSSYVKQMIDVWYEKKLRDEGNVLSGATGFCGDRGLANYKPYGYNNYGYRDERTYYKAYDRISGYAPSFDCYDNVHDLYTAKSEKGDGNGALTYPIGLITIDEVEYAGRGDGNNYGYWLRTSKIYWTITPYYLHGVGADVVRLMSLIAASGTYANVFVVDSNSLLDSNSDVGSVDKSYGVRPVVNVLPQYFHSSGHDGTITNPYIVES